MKKEERKKRCPDERKIEKEEKRRKELQNLKIKRLNEMTAGSSDDGVCLKLRHVHAKL